MPPGDSGPERRSPVSMTRPRSIRLVGLWLAATAAMLAAVPVSATEVRDPLSIAVPFVRTFRDADGLPQNTVNAMALDAEGRLWVGTQDGVARYDGRTWETIELPLETPNRFIRDLLATSDGALWFGTLENGLLRWRDGAWLHVPPSPRTIPTPRVNTLAETGPPEARTLWVGLHDGGLASFDGSKWNHWRVRDGLPSDRVWDLEEISEPGGPQLWVATDEGVAILDLATGALTALPELAGLPCNSLAKSRDANGGQLIWVGTYGHGLLRRGRDGWARLQVADGLPSLFLTDLEAEVEDSRRLWLATDGGGVAIADEQSIRPVTLGPSFDSAAAYRLFETTASQGAAALWVGTRNNGLLRVAESGWRLIQPPTESTFVSVSALSVDSVAGGADLWVGLDGRGLWHWSGGSWRHFSHRTGELGHDTVQALLTTRRVGDQARTWVGTRNGGLSELRGGRWIRHDASTGALSNDLVQTLAEVRGSSGAELWVGTREGGAIFDGRRWRPLPGDEELARTSILTLLPEPGEAGSPTTVWIGTTTGLVRWRDGRVERWSTADGLPVSSVLSLHLERDLSGRRALWIGTDGGGLARLDPDLEHPVPELPAGGRVPQLGNGVVHAIVEDLAHRIYVSTNRGVYRFFADRDGFNIESFTTEQGLPLNQGMHAAATVDDAGRVWIGTVGGLAVLAPASDRVDRAPKRLLLEFARGSRPDVRLASGVELPSDLRTLHFHYALLSFVGESLTRYRTELIGLDRAPTAWSASGEREVSGLGPGAYRFRVWGRDAAGNVSEPSEVSFSIRPAFWRTWWFYLAVAAILVGLARLWLMRRSLQHARREADLAALIAVRTRQLERANQLLAELSYVDPLTAVPNRRRFDELLEVEWKRSIRTRLPLAIVMIDVDNFKLFNDDLGHPAGDECLRRIASTLADALPRAGDTVTRYGGEEFAAILPATDLDGGRRVAESFRRAVQAAAIPHPAIGAGGRITVSCGVAAAVPGLRDSAGDLVAEADRALYRAKREGKDRVVVATNDVLA